MRKKDHPLYPTYKMMLARCHNPKHAAYHNYGGRGIYVCKRWKESADAFYQDVGNRPAGHTLDRIDNDGPYSPENCRWSTPSAQARNSRKVILFWLDGRQHTIGELSVMAGVSHETMRRRLVVYGWPVQKALSYRAHPKFEFCGSFLCLKEIARKLNIPATTLWNRIYTLKMSPLEAFVKEDLRCQRTTN